MRDLIDKEIEHKTMSYGESKDSYQKKRQDKEYLDERTIKVKNVFR